MAGERIYRKHGARRLHTVLERLMEEISYDAAI